jgi:ribosomal protein L24E
MTKKCKFCGKEVDSGIWISPQFKDEKVLLFCSDRCKNKYIKAKLKRIKIEYPKYYSKLIKNAKRNQRTFRMVSAKTR